MDPSSSEKKLDNTLSLPKNDSGYIADHLNPSSINLLDVDRTAAVHYRVYKERFLGVTAIALLNLASGMVWPWFGPIAVETSSTFRISTFRVDWLSNIVQVGGLIFSILLPFLSARIRVRGCFFLGQACLVLGAWVRYAGTIHSLSVDGAYALLLVGQFLSSAPVAFFLNLAPLYSEMWFDPSGRTTATMAMSIANPLGGAIGQVISPLVGGPRQSILVLAIICTALTPLVFFIRSQPPTPPSLAGSKRPPPEPTILAILGMLPDPATIDADVAADYSSQKSVQQWKTLYMSRRERLDFAILVMVFGVHAGSSNAFALLSNEILGPYGYSPKTAGLMGGTLLLAGIVSAALTSTLFDRVLAHHFGLSCKLVCPIIAGCWLSLIWAVREDNAPVLYIIFAIIGICCMTMLPVTLELGVELTRNADTSASILWANGTVFTILFMSVANSLRAPSTAHPPRNMRSFLILIAVCDVAFVLFVVIFRGKQTRREMDESAAKETADAIGRC